MANKKRSINEAAIRNGDEILVIGDIVADLMALHFANKRPPLFRLTTIEQSKVIGIYILEIPYNDESKAPHEEIWLNLEVVASPTNSKMIGLQWTDPAHGYSRIEGKRTFADYAKKHNELVSWAWKAHDNLADDLYDYRKDELVEQLSDILSDD